jgi:hypothetical protein
VLISRLFLFFWISCKASTQSDLPSVARTPKVFAIFQEAQAGERPIRIVAIPHDDARSLYSGETVLDDMNEITIRLNFNLSGEVAENNLVHELFHVILYKRGFKFTVGSFHFKDPGFAGYLYVGIAKALTNCFVDPIIDRAMYRKGFRPELVNQMTADGIASAKEADLLRSLNTPQSTFWVTAESLQLYCLSLRPGNFQMKAVEKAFKSVQPVLDNEHLLQKRMGMGLCKTPEACFQRMIHLRQLAGLNGEIWLMNPQTGRYE